jgi:hypothetical protein
MRHDHVTVRVHVLTSYWVDHLCDDSRPLEVVQATLELHWPKRVFILTAEARQHQLEGERLFYVGDFEDAATGENAFSLVRKHWDRLDAAEPDDGEGDDMMPQAQVAELEASLDAQGAEADAGDLIAQCGLQELAAACDVPVELVQQAATWADVVKLIRGEPAVLGDLPAPSRN